MASRIAAVNRVYKFKRPGILETDGAHLPESYKKFYKEWKKTQPKPVHYIPPSNEWVRNEETGEVKRLQNVPIPVLFPPESHSGIWGGEGVIKGFQKRISTKQRVPHFWVPNLKKGVIYSEILNATMSITLTSRTIDLIIENHGFDHYILKTKACDLQSGLALKLKRKMLLSLYNRDLYPDNPIKANEVYEKYKHYLNEYTKEDIDWYGWTIYEAIAKYKAELEVKPVPLKFQLRNELLQKLIEQKLAESDAPPADDRSWIQKINPFGKN